EMVVRERLEKDRTAIRSSIFLDCQRAAFHVVFVFGFWGVPFKRLSRVIAGMVTGIRDEKMIRRFEHRVVHIAGQIVEIGVTPVIGTVPITVVIKAGNEVEYRRLRFLINDWRIVCSKSTILGVLGS